MIRNVIGMFFSPSGETAKITKKITTELSERLDELCVDPVEHSFTDLLVDPVKEDLHFDDESIVVIGMPVYSGRIPEVCSNMLKKIHGSDTLAIVIVTYGNNTYGDALRELYSIACDQEFGVVSAGAFVAKNPMFTTIAGDRPDAFDLQQIIEFSKVSANKIRRFCGTEIKGMKAMLAPLNVKGDIPTRKPSRYPVHPVANSFCINCGKCSAICPVGAIDPSNPRKVDGKKCISCSACINVCPQEARSYGGPLYAASRVALERLYNKRKDPEWFI